MTQRIIIFDGVCKFCHFAVNFIIQRDPNCQFVFAPMQSAAAKQLCQQYNIDNIDLNTLVLIQNDHCFIRSRAVFKICAQLTGAWGLLSIFSVLPQAITDLPYRFIARFRYRLWGRFDSCPLPSKATKKRFLDDS
ncbi:thiol-disulfide oxidoreductase DCC family protein [Oceanicoccus sp. KOV_DT_Chl]|uniref:thiol-disulfide oxidoreductase DCC family protein n=1 Tax=Oceanicoccus sp. KOV_DT_Chl TaxID=1904639 RepID=UPI000C7A3A29|nr:DCC1-like thiol-disulfide oxidoreductase family protein [Oceanicoccus sp. KOV_DT_Chl]